MIVKANKVGLARAALTDDYEQTDEGGRWPGDTDGITTRPYLVVPYRFKSNFPIDKPMDMVRMAMDRVSHEYMSGCIRFVDDTDNDFIPV